MCKSPTRHRPIADALLIFGLVMGAGTAVAQPLPIHIESNTADLSQQSGVSTYTGNVVLSRGGLTLTGSKLTIKRINDRGNVRAELQGSPAHLDKQPDRAGDATVTGHADRIEYSNSNSTVVLRGDAVVNRGKDQVTGQVIRHNIDTERTQAERGSGNDRVRITITPEKDGDKP